MTTITRGKSVVLKVAAWVTSAGQPMTPNAATVVVRYKVSGIPVVKALGAMVNAGGVWSLTWDSTPADADLVDWTATALGTEKIVEDGQFMLAAGAANGATPT